MNEVRIDSPIGPLRLISNGEALTGLYMEGHWPAPKVGTSHGSVAKGTHPGGGILAETQRQLGAFFAGDLREFDLPLGPIGTEFQLQVWKELERIPYGTTISYGELARRVGDPKLARAVGTANGQNPISIIVPCHRVIGADGSLTGYGGGLARKKFLLELEGQPALF